MKTRIWNYTESFPGKVNFIDDNNVILGYDLGQDCCEHAFWTVSEAKDGSEPLHQGDDTESKEIELEGYVFDPAFCERSDDDGGGATRGHLQASASRLPRGEAQSLRPTGEPPQRLLRARFHVPRGGGNRGDFVG